ncbi:heat repeat-containing protein [Nitzschia inconspicua]|uniref:Heat repeat-containing protein n=1 Tax=Nitzschia inconspicua TaxID=303405 RepID=A0A9K3M1A5_9STRA|nr:heat repeat-containing protein [Nitzschia inconspicua]
MAKEKKGNGGSHHTAAQSIAQGVDELNQMSAFDLFRTQMETGSSEAKVDAMKRMPVVAYAMGISPVSSDLLPYLQQIALQQPPMDDELLLLMAKQLQTFVPALLSKPSQILDLLPIVERLAAVEETVVRNEAVVLMNHLCAHLITSAPLDSSVVSTLVSMAKRLVGADWFTAKVSAAGMLPELYTLTKHSELAFLYKELCMDETPMVRRAAAQFLGQFLETLGGKDKAIDLIPVFQQLCKDEQDSVRMLAISSMANVGPNYGKVPEWTKEIFLPLLKDGSTDTSWRVRHNLAKNFSDVATNLGFQGNSKYAGDQALVMACFVSVLTDAEAEVRAAAVGHYARMVHWGGSALFTSYLMPLLPSLADDVVMEVRSKTALAIMDSSEGGTLEDSLIVQTFGPLLESFLQDEFQEVQLQVLGNLHKLSHLLNGMNGVVSSILNMSKATNWRVREGVAKLLPHLAEARGLDFFANVLLEPAWLVLLLDPVACVRSACVSGMSVLVGVAGQDWMVEHILPQHVRIYNHAASGSYLIRITILQAHAETAFACQVGNAAAGGGTLWNDTVLQLLRGLQDKVANVRMVAAQGLKKVVTADDPVQVAVVQAQIMPALEKRMAEEEDPDCRQACSEAIAAVPKK